MPNLVIFTQVGPVARSVALSVDSVAYARVDPKNSARCYVGTLAVNGEVLHIASTAAALCAALGVAAGIVVAGQPTAPFALLPLAGGGSIYTRTSAVTYVRQDNGLPLTRCYINTTSQGLIEGPWLIALTVAAVQVLLEAAQPPVTPGGTGLGAVVVARMLGTGVIESQSSTQGTTLATTGPYTPGDGAFGLLLGGANVPTEYIVVVTSLSIAGGGTQFSAAPFSPGNPVFVVQARSNPIIGLGKMNSAGVLQAGNYGLACNRTGPGTYDVTAQTAVDGAAEANLLATLGESGAGSGRIVNVVRTGNGTWTVETYDVVALSTQDAALELAAFWGSDKDHAPGADAYFQLAVFSLDP